MVEKINLKICIKNNVRVSKSPRCALYTYMENSAKSYTVVTPELLQKNVKKV